MLDIVGFEPEAELNGVTKSALAVSIPAVLGDAFASEGGAGEV
jgi:hypothetical protein